MAIDEILDSLPQLLLVFTLVWNLSQKLRSRDYMGQKQYYATVLRYNEVEDTKPIQSHSTAYSTF